MKLHQRHFAGPSPAPSPSGSGGEEMSCSCKMPLMDETPTGRKLNSAASRVLERKKRATRDWQVQDERGHKPPSNSYNNGLAFGSLLQVVVLASLAALAGIGKATLIQALAGTINTSTSRKGETEATRTLNSINRQDLGGLLGGLGGLLGGAGGSGSETGTGQIEGAIEQALLQQISEYLSGGGMETLMSNLLESEDLGQQLGEMVNNLIGNFDINGMVASLSEQLGNDLGEMTAMVSQAMEGSGMQEVVNSLLGEIDQGQMEGLLEGVNLSELEMEMMMNCECKSKN